MNIKSATLLVLFTSFLRAGPAHDETISPRSPSALQVEETSALQLGGNFTSLATELLSFSESLSFRSDQVYIFGQVKIDISHVPHSLQPVIKDIFELTSHQTRKPNNSHSIWYECCDMLNVENHPELEGFKNFVLEIYEDSLDKKKEAFAQKIEEIGKLILKLPYVLINAQNSHAGQLYCLITWLNPCKNLLLFRFLFLASTVEVDAVLAQKNIASKNNDISSLMNNISQLKAVSELIATKKENIEACVIYVNNNRGNIPKFLLYFLLNLYLSGKISKSDINFPIEPVALLISLSINIGEIIKLKLLAGDTDQLKTLLDSYNGQLDSESLEEIHCDLIAATLFRAQISDTMVKTALNVRKNSPRENLLNHSKNETKQTSSEVFNTYNHTSRPPAEFKSVTELLFMLAVGVFGSIVLMLIYWYFSALFLYCEYAIDGIMGFFATVY